MSSVNLSLFGKNGASPTVGQAFSPSAGRRVAGGLIGGALNFVAPGIGSLVGNAIGGNSVPSNPLTGSLMDDMQRQNQEMLVFQYKMNQENRIYETASNVVKARHDTDMNAIRNIKG